jgi:hypothetical protein
MAGHLGSHLVRACRGRLDGQRQLLVAAALLAQVGPDCFGEQSVPEAQATARPDDQPAVQDVGLGGVAVGQRQRGELGRRQLTARGGQHLGQVPGPARQ